MFSEHGVVSVGDLLESLGLKEKSTDAGRRGSDGAKMDAQIHRLPPYFFLPRSSSTQSMDGECDEPRALDLTAATVSIEEKLVEKVGVGFTHAKEIAEEVLAAVGRVGASMDALLERNRAARQEEAMQQRHALEEKARRLATNLISSRLLSISF